jgi:hypothetical protein
MASRKRREGKTAKQGVPAFLPRVTSVDDWLKAKSQYPSVYTVTSDGNLQIPATKPGEVGAVIEIHPKVPASPEHVLATIEERNESLKGPEAEFAEAKRALQGVVRAYQRGEAEVHEVLKANQQTNVAQCKLNAIVKYPRTFRPVVGLQFFDLDFDKYRKGKIQEVVGTLETNEFSWEPHWMVPPRQQIELEEEEDLYNDSDSDASTPKPAKKPLTAQQRAIIANVMKKRRAGM